MVIDQKEDAELDKGRDEVRHQRRTDKWTGSSEIIRNSR
jgi:hypothetical protein